MNIGIDIDGVLTDLAKYIIEYGSKMCIEENWTLNINAEEYWETKTFNWEEGQDEKFWNKYLVHYVTEYNPRIFANEIIQKLKQEGNNIYIITARDESGLPPEAYGKMQELTKNWLEKNNSKYDKLIFASDDEKLKQCIDNDIDIMIEDSPNNIINISSKIPVIKFWCRYNKKIEGENIITGYSWYHIYDIIKKWKIREQP